MKKLLTICLLAAGGFTLGATTSAQNQAAQHVTGSENVYFNTVKGNNLERSVNFDDNWRFNLGDLNNAHQKSFDDSRWESVDLPHDYSINQDYTNSIDGESGYKPGGIGWYRKTFNIDDSFTADHSIRLDFDGVYMDSTVYLNGERLGAHPYGYTPFSFDITSKVKRDSENVIAVKVNHETPSSRWYSGSGIYRSVHLTITNDIHVDLHGSKFDVVNLKGDTPEVTIKGTTTVKNNYATAKSVNIKYELHEKTDKGLKLITSSQASNVSEIAMLNTGKFNIDFNVNRKDIKLWDTNNPNMYVIRTLVMENEKVLDTYDVDYGFRYTDWTANEGFSLNGKKMKLQGVCMHHDQGALGAVANKDAQERQVKILKEMGVNTIRVTHNPASQTLIDLANEHGMLLIEEVFDGWHRPKNNNSKDYSRFFNQTVGTDNNLVGATNNMPWHEFDLRATVERGYNAPSIIMWSLGNEIQEGTASSALDQSYVDNHKKLVDILKTMDKNRYVTTGDNALKRNDRFAITIANKNVEAGGAAGFNYANGSQYDKFHNENPTWLMYGAETSSAINSRGVYYKTDGNDSNYELTSYDRSRVGWGALSSESWFEIIKRDFMAGEFVWTGFDYLGEPTPWNQIAPNSSTPFPRPKSSFFGIVDTAGMPKDRYYFYQSQWAPEKNTLHVLPTWDKNNIKLDSNGNALVNVYSSASKVKLELFNKEGKSVWTGEQTMSTFKSNTGLYEYKARNNGQNHTDLYYEFNVPYQEGKLVATAYDELGNVIEKTTGRNEVVSSTRAHKLQATVNKTSITADKDSLAYIQVDVVDASGNIVSKADNLITTTVKGNGRYLVMDNGKQADMTPYTNNSRQAYNGSVVAIVAGNGTTGKMTVTFSAANLESVSVTIDVTAPTNVLTGPQGVNMNRNYYIITGTKPNLPTTVSIINADGSQTQKSVVWNDENNYSQKGVYYVNGTIDGKYKTSVIVTAIDGVAGVYNTSIRTQKGVTPKLPTSLTPYDIHGDKLTFNLDVKWNMPSEEAFNRFGTITINGTTTFLGKEYPVIATVSIREGLITISNVSISSSALDVYDKLGTNLHSTKDIIKKLYDGNKNISADLLKGTWNNYEAVNKGFDNSEIIFEYATQTTLGRFKVAYVNKPTFMEAPKPYTTKILVSESGLDGSWVELEYNETINKLNADVVEYTYDVTPIIGTFIKFQYETNKNTNVKTYLGITEIEILNGSTSYPLSNNASLEELVINGVKYSGSTLTNTLRITDDVADITYKVRDNASVTILPVKDNQVRVMVTSEDNTKVNTYTIHLNASASVLYKGKLTVVSAPEAQSADLGADKLVDGITKFPNHYHSKWANGTNLNLSETNSQSIILDTGEGNKRISGFRYLPRYGEPNANNGCNNGRVRGFKIYVSTTNGNWGEPVYKGTFEDKEGWKRVNFQVKEGRFVRFEVTSSYGVGGQNKYIAGKEVGLFVDGNILNNSLEVSLFNTKTIDQNTPINVTFNNQTLRKGYDYDVKFDVAQDKVNATVTGKGIYKGTVTKEVLLADTTIKSVELLNNPYMFYAVGDVISSDALLVRLTNIKGQVINVSAKDYKDIFTFDKALFDNHLVAGEKTTKVTVLENEFTLTINVLQDVINNDHNAFINEFTLSERRLAKFTTTSIDNYKASLKQLIDLVVKGESLDKIYTAKKDVLTKVNSLVLQGNTSNLESLVNEKVDSSLYTKESYNKFMSTVLSIQEKLLNKEALSEADVFALTNEYNEAKNGLVDINSVKPDRPLLPIQPSEPVEKPGFPATPILPGNPTEKPGTPLVPINPSEPVEKPSTPLTPIEPSTPVITPEVETPEENNNLGLILGLSIGIPAALATVGLATFLVIKYKKKD